MSDGQNKIIINMGKELKEIRKTLNTAGITRTEVTEEKQAETVDGK